jgi:hypothetical protein
LFLLLAFEPNTTHSEIFCFYFFFFKCFIQFSFPHVLLCQIENNKLLIWVIFFLFLCFSVYQKNSATFFRGTPRQHIGPHPIPSTSVGHSPFELHISASSSINRPRKDLLQVILKFVGVSERGGTCCDKLQRSINQHRPASQQLNFSIGKLLHHLGRPPFS